MTGQGDRLSTALSDRYRIERELGAGGMATVYLAHDDVQLQVSAEGASEPVWSRNTGEIFYRAGPNLIAAKLQLGPEPRVVERVPLFDASLFDTSGPHANYDVSPDGKWFVFARRGGSNHIVVLQNVAELARRLARGGSSTP